MNLGLPHPLARRADVVESLRYSGMRFLIIPFPRKCLRDRESSVRLPDLRRRPARRQPLAYRHDCLGNRALLDQHRAVQEERLHDEGNALLGSECLSHRNTGRSQFGFAAVQMNHCGIAYGDFNAERMGYPFAQSLRLANLEQSPVRIAEQPVELCGSIPRAHSGIVTTIDMAM